MCPKGLNHMVRISGIVTCTERCFENVPFKVSRLFSSFWKQYVVAVLV